MFSRRTGWLREPNPIARRLEALRAAGAPLIDLTETNPTRVGLRADRAWLADVLTDGAIDHYEPEPFGATAAREALAAWLSARGPVVAPEDVVLTASTSEAYAWLFKLLCDPGDSVLVPHPSYPLFEYLTGLEAVETREYPLHFDGEWHLDVADLARIGDARTRAVLVVNPGNPTGAYLKRGELEVLSELCAERGWALVSDEVFAEDATEGAPAHRVVRAATRSSRALTFSLAGLSKIALLPQLKLGWIVIGGPDGLRDEARARLELIADTWLSVNTPVQIALPRVLEQVPALKARLRDRLRINRGRLSAFAGSDAAWSLLPAEGGWSQIIRIPARVSEEEVCLRLLDEGVIVHPGYFFDFAANCHLVVSLIAEEGVFAEGARRLAAVLDAL